MIIQTLYNLIDNSKNYYAKDNFKSYECCVYTLASLITNKEDKKMLLNDEEKTIEEVIENITKYQNSDNEEVVRYANMAIEALLHAREELYCLDSILN